jgi:hypothetical protein
VLHERNLEQQDNDMQIHINTDHHIDGSEARDAWARSVVESALGRFGDAITRVEVHFNLESGGKPGAGETRCMMEARLSGLPPIAVTHHAGELDVALNGAVRKLVHALDHAAGRENRHARDPRAMPVGDLADDAVVSPSAPV